MRLTMAAQNSGGKSRINAQYHAAIRNFEAGVRLFQRQSFDKAKELFEKLATNSPPEVGNRACVYLRLCEQKLAPTVPSAKSRQEYYDLGVAQLNARNLERALEYLTKAQRTGPDQEYVRYALAAAYALGGNLSASIEHLTVAIQLRPANRSLARQDEDFQALADDPRFRQLIHSGDS